MDDAADLVNDINAHSDKNTGGLNPPVKKSVKTVALKRHFSQEFTSQDLDAIDRKVISKDMDTLQQSKASVSRPTEKTQNETDNAERNLSDSEVMNCHSKKQLLQDKQERKLAVLDVDDDETDSDDDMFNVESKRIKSEHELLVSVVTSLQNNQEKDETDDVFGKYVGKEIANISNFRAKQMAKFKILNMIFDAQFVNEASSLPRNSAILSQQSGLSSVLNTQTPLLNACGSSDTEVKHRPAILYPEIKVNDASGSVTPQHKESLSNAHVIADKSPQKGLTTSNCKLRNRTGRKFSDDNCDVQ